MKGNSGSGSAVNFLPLNLCLYSEGLRPCIFFSILFAIIEVMDFVSTCRYLIPCLLADILYSFLTISVLFLINLFP